jgi:3-phenylpropionate/trans-cinnamate dioxygenase ferredoxin reductase component
MSSTPANLPTSDAAAMVIIGAGHAGGRVAAALRAQGWTGPIELIGAEPALPYERPPLSKAVLTGEASPEACALRPAADYEGDRISHRVARVAALDTAARTVTLADGSVIAYRAALLATGGHARPLTIPGADQPGVLALRTLADAAALAPRLTPGARLALIGGGFIGLEVAASARHLGCQVTVLEGAPRLLGRAVPASIGDKVLALHRARGVDVRLGCGPTQIDAADGALAVHLSDGSMLAADTVVVGIGITPATELAQAAGLRVARGIVVDATLATSAPGVYAAGDVAEFPSAFSGDLIRQETWHNAETQARVAAANMLGGTEAYRSTPWFWSDQYDWQLQVTGEPALAAQSAVRALGPDAELHFYLDADGRLVGCSGVGPTSVVAKELKLARTLVERGARPTAEQLADPAVKLKSLLSAA